MKKFVLLSLLLVAALVIFAACNRNGDEPGADDTITAEATPTPEPPTDNNGNENGEEETTALPPADGDTIVLTYANWNLGTEEENNLERRMIQAFMDEHPHIRIEIDESITGDWTEALAMAAAISSLPDVFMVNDTGTMAANGWLMDISGIANADPEFMALPAAVRGASTVGNTVYTVPFAQFMMGYFVNRTLFEEFNLDPPEFGVSVDEFLDLVRQTTDLNRPTMGLNYANNLIYWLPGARNSNYGFFGYDGTAYVLNSAEMLEAVSLAAELTATGMTFGGLTYEQREAFPMPWAGGNFNQGMMAFMYDGSWAMGHLPRYAAEAGFELDFIGLPGGNVVLTLDSLGIAATSQHPEEAYLFARWMGHGVDGYLRRIEIARENAIHFNSLPVSNDARVLAAFEELETLPGISTALRYLDNALIDGNKIVPGHIQGRFYAQTGISIPGTEYDNATVNQVIHHSIVGTINFADHADAVNAASRAAMEEAIAAIGN